MHNPKHSKKGLTENGSLAKTNIKKLLVFFLFTQLFILSPASAVFPEQTEEPSRFFSCERFTFNKEAIDKITTDKRIRGELRLFIGIFSEAVNDCAEKRFPDAEKKLQAAKTMWPEHFAPDFVLALIYENKKDLSLSARFYKSYLNKLKLYYSGKYSMSNSFIRTLSACEIESYENAAALVSERLAHRGIILAKVRPICEVPCFLLTTFGAIGVVALYLFWRHRMSPYFRKLYRIKNPPEGFWVCRFCGRDNPLLCNECDGCRRKR